MDLYNYDEDKNRKIRGYKFFGIVIGICLIFLACFFIINPVEARTTDNSSLFVTSETSHSISWNYTYLTANRPIGASLDGVVIVGWKTDYIFNYTASELEPNTVHEFCIFGEATSNCVSGKTLIEEKKSDEKVWDFMFEYVLLFMTVIFLLVGFKIPILGLVGSIFSVMGVVSALPKGNFYLDLIFAVGIFAGFTVVYLGVEK